MSYTTGTCAGANPAIDLMAQCKTAITAVSGWSFIETTTATTYTADVYKSAAASNSFGQDFYVSLIRAADAGTTTLQLRPSEGYNAGTHCLVNHAPGGTQTITPAATTFLNPQADETPAKGFLHVSNYAVSVTVSVINPFVLSVTPDRIILATSPPAGAFVGHYCGLYDTLLPITDPFPLCAISLSVGSPVTTASLGSCTREPGQTASYSKNFYIQFAESAPFTTAGLSKFGPLGTNAGVDVYAGYAYVGRPMFFSSRFTGSSGQTNPATRGLLKPDAVTFNTVSAGVLGDTITIGGQTYGKVGGSIFVSTAA